MSMAYGEFLSAYRNSPYTSDWRSWVRKPRWDRYWLGFCFRFRVPNRCGFYATAPEAVGARWCWPWQWYRLYYAARFPS